MDKARTPLVHDHWLRRIGRHALAALLVALTTAIAGLLSLDRLAEADIVLMYLLAITATAALYGLEPAIVAAALSVAAFDWFFVPPFHTFTVESSRHLLTFGMMFAVGVFVSGVATRLRQQRFEAEVRRRTDEVRGALLSAVSHDLRTPLAAIAGAATALQQDNAPLPDADRRALLDSIAGQAFHLERLVSELLDMTRVEAGAFALRKEWVPAEEIVGSALERMRAQLGSREVRTELAADLPLLHVDPVLFEQVLVNLLDNVARHTPATTNVLVSARRLGADVELSVADDGPGLPPGVAVFEKLVRGPGAQGGGLGLGLAICKSVVEAHGGTIAAAPGSRGARIVIALPLPPAPPGGP